MFPGTVHPAGAATYFRGPVDSICAVYRHGGISAFYRGFGVYAVRDINAASIYFLVYEWLYHQLVLRHLTDTHGVVASFVAGGFAGMLSWLPVLPFDVVKSRMQADFSRGTYDSVWHCVGHTYTTGGMPAFFAGIGVTMVRAFLVNAVTFVVYARTLDLLG